MLINQEFAHINQTFSRYSELLQRKKVKSKYSALLGSSIYLTVLVSMISVIVLYHHGEFFQPVLSGKYKLFGTNVPVMFSVALVIVIPSFILLVFLIYRVCTAQNLTEELIGEVNSIISSAQKVCGFLERELESSKDSLNAVVNDYKSLRSQCDTFFRECSANFDKVSTECTRLNALLSQTKATVDSRYKMMQNVVEDIKEKLTQLSVCHSSVRDGECKLQKSIIEALKVEGALLDNKIQLLQNLRVDLSTPLASMDGVKGSIEAITATIQSLVPKKTSLFSRYSSLYACMWKLCNNLSSSYSEIGILRSDACSEQVTALLKILDEFSSDFEKEVKSYSGDDIAMLKDIGFVKVGLLRVRLLRFLLGRRSSMLASACSSLQGFIECGALLSPVDDNDVSPSDNEGAVGGGDVPFVTGGLGMDAVALSCVGSSGSVGSESRSGMDCGL